MDFKPLNKKIKATLEKRHGRKIDGRIKAV